MVETITGEGRAPTDAEMLGRMDAALAVRIRERGELDEQLQRAYSSDRIRALEIEMRLRRADEAVERARGERQAVFLRIQARGHVRSIRERRLEDLRTAVRSLGAEIGRIEAAPPPEDGSYAECCGMPKASCGCVALRIALRAATRE